MAAAPPPRTRPPPPGATVVSSSAAPAMAPARSQQCRPPMGVIKSTLRKEPIRSAENSRSLVPILSNSKHMSKKLGSSVCLLCLALCYRGQNRLHAPPRASSRATQVARPTESPPSPLQQPLKPMTRASIETENNNAKHFVLVLSNCGARPASCPHRGSRGDAPQVVFTGSPCHAPPVYVSDACACPGCPRRGSRRHAPPRHAPASDVSDACVRPGCKASRPRKDSSRPCRGVRRDAPQSPSLRLTPPRPASVCL